MELTVTHREMANGSTRYQVINEDSGFGATVIIDRLGRIQLFGAENHCKNFTKEAIAAIANYQTN